MLPFYSQRFELIYRSLAQSPIGNEETSKKPAIDYFRNVIADLAIYYKPSVECAVSFFTPDRCVFASDYPYGPDAGREFLESAMETVGKVDLDEEDKTKIFERNAASILKL